MKRNWKTTIAGLGVLLTTLGNAIAEWKAGGIGAINFGVLFAGISTAVGLILAKDFNVSGQAAPAP